MDAARTPLFSNLYAQNRNVYLFKWYHLFLILQKLYWVQLVGIKMQVEDQSKQRLGTGIAEHTIIRRLLVGTFSYYDAGKRKWRNVTNFGDPECQSDRITVRCKHARQSLQIPYPFTMETELCYLWGLLAGGAYVNRQLELCVDANQEAPLQAIADLLGVQIQVTPVARARRKRGAKRPPARYRKIQVKFPFVVKKFLQSLRYNPKKPGFPSWFDADQRRAWVEGYLNSPKLQCNIRKGTGLRPRVHIHIAQNDPDLFSYITEVLDTLSISYLSYKCQRRLQIVIQKRPDILRFGDCFEIARPKILSLLALLREFEHNPSLRVSLQKFALTEFQLTLYGIVLAQPLEELEYTLFEQLFASSSNEIRHEFYLLDSLGLITYYKKENNKEFLGRSMCYLTKVQQILKAEEKELRQQLKLSDSNALSFHCQECGTTIGYTDAMETHSFACPRCASQNLSPIETSRYFYYGHLGRVAHQNNILQRGVL